MQDLRFNPRERDIYIESGDLDVAADSDTGLQNGFILAGTAMCTPLYPPIGLSLVDAIGSELLPTLIRWQNMAYTDGAKSAEYRVQGNDVVLITEY